MIISQYAQFVVAFIVLMQWNEYILNMKARFIVINICKIVMIVSLHCQLKHIK